MNFITNYKPDRQVFNKSLSLKKATRKFIKYFTFFSFLVFFPFLSFFLVYYFLSEFHLGLYCLLTVISPPNEIKLDIKISNFPKN